MKCLGKALEFITFMKAFPKINVMWSIRNPCGALGLLLEHVTLGLVGMCMSQTMHWLNAEQTAVAPANSPPHFPLIYLAQRSCHIGTCHSNPHYITISTKYQAFTCITSADRSWCLESQKVKLLWGEHVRIEKCCEYVFFRGGKRRSGYNMIIDWKKRSEAHKSWMIHAWIMMNNG